MATKTVRIGFLLLDQFTMIALASAVDPLRMANQLSGEELYNWHVIGSDNQSVLASDGIRVSVDETISDDFSYDILFVVGGINITQTYSKRELAWLAQLNRKKTIIGGLCTGAYVLAHAGLLDGQECSVHWECAASLQEKFPRVTCNNRLFTVSRSRLTCSGGVAPMDMMLYNIAIEHGHTLANAVANMFVCDRVRSHTDHQRVPLRHMLSIVQPKLMEVVELMEANIEEPIELEDLAGFVGISRRQQERLFHKYLDCTPSRFYLGLRLERARQLLKQSFMSVIDIAGACGFVSPAHFSRCYRKHIGLSPREERSSGRNLGLSNNNGHINFDHVKECLQAARNEPSFASVKVHMNS